MKECSKLGKYFALLFALICSNGCAYYVTKDNLDDSWTRVIPREEKKIQYRISSKTHYFGDGYMNSSNKSNFYKLVNEILVKTFPQAQINYYPLSRDEKYLGGYFIDETKWEGLKKDQAKQDSDLFFEINAKENEESFMSWSLINGLVHVITLGIIPYAHSHDLEWEVIAYDKSGLEVSRQKIKHTFWEWHSLFLIFSSDSKIYLGNNDLLEERYRQSFGEYLYLFEQKYKESP